MRQSSGIKRIGVIGLGTMGRGIAQLAAQAGLQTVVYDMSADMAEQAMSALRAVWQRMEAKGKLPQGRAEAYEGHITLAHTLAEFQDCDVVVEAIVENLEIKQQLFQKLEAILAPDAIIATNTSSLSVTAVAAACDHSERVVGWHFFNPVPLMRIAEVVRAEQTASWAVAALSGLTQRMGHHPVPAVDMPGFVVNHAGRAYIPEGLRLLSEGIASHAEIDAIMKDCCGFRMGPFELLDLIGLDVAKMVMESLYDQYYQEPRFRITPLVAKKVAAGHLGRKTGQGFYRYEQGKVVVEPVPGHASMAAGKIWVCNEHPELAARVRQCLSSAGQTLVDGAEPPADALIVVTPVGLDVSTTCARNSYDYRRTVGIDAMFDLVRRRSLMFAPGVSEPCKAAAVGAFSADGAQLTLLRDSPGFVAQRMLAQIISIGCDIAQQRIAVPEDIDVAVKLALGYPRGPFEFGESLGTARVLAVSDALFDAYRDPRYRASSWLRRRAQLGVPLHMPD